MRYYYLRVSTPRQYFTDQIKKLNLNNLSIIQTQDYNEYNFRVVYCKNCKILQEVATGFSFDNREGFIRLLNSLKYGDELYISDVTRLGRKSHLTYYMMIRIEEIIGEPIHFKDIEQTVGSFYKYDSYMDYRQVRDKVILERLLEEEAKEERKRKRRLYGIKKMPINVNGKKYSVKTGKLLGHPPIESTNLYKVFKILYQQKLENKITGKEIREKLSMGESVYKKYRSRVRKELGLNKKSSLDSQYPFR